MQEPKADNDEELIGKVNEALNNPGGSSSGRGLMDSSSTPSEQEMQNLLQSMNQTQLMQLIGGMPKSTNKINLYGNIFADGTLKNSSTL